MNESALFITGLTSFIIGLVVFALVIGFSVIEFNRTGSGNFNFLKFFPYELNRFKRYNKQSYIYVLGTALASILIYVPVICFLLIGVNKFGMSSNTISRLIFSILLFANILIFNILTFVKLTNFRVHMIMTGIFVMLNLVITVFLLTVLGNPDLNVVSSEHGEVRITGLIISGALIILQAILMFNKSITNWAKMVRLDAETICRPKHCYLAMLEWGNFIILLALIITIQIVFLF